MKSTSNVCNRLLGILFAAIVFSVGASAAQAAERKLTFACCVKGVIEEVLVKPGDKVQAGQPLARIDASMFKLRVGVEEAKVEAAELTYTVAKKNLQRQQELFDAISTTSSKVEEAEIKLANANANLLDARAHLELAKFKLAFATLKAPFDGTVASVPGFVGQVMNPDVPAEAVIVLDDEK